MKTIISCVIVVPLLFLFLTSATAREIKRDNYGNVYVFVQYQGRLNIDNLSLSFGDSMGNLSGNYNLLLTKYDTSGNFIWLRSFKGDLLNVCDMAFDHNDDNFIIALSGGNLSYEGQLIADAHLMKLDTAGNIIWSKQFIGDKTPEAHLSLDKQDNIYFSGTYKNSLVLDNLSLPPALPNYGPQTFISKMTPSGQAIWMKSISAQSGIQENFFLAVDSGGNSYTGGMAEGVMVYGTDTINNDYFHQYLAKTDANGNPVFLKNYPMISTNQTHALFSGGEVSSNGNLYLSGAVSSSTVVNEMDTLHRFNRCLYIARTNQETGMAQWHRTDSVYITGSYSEASSLSVDNSDNVFTIGASGGGGKITESNIVTPDGDFYIVFDSSGTFKCMQSYERLIDGDVSKEGYYTVSALPDTSSGLFWPRKGGIVISRWDKNNCGILWEKKIYSTAYIITLGIDENSDMNKMTFYPNPSASGIFYKSNEKHWDGSKVYLFNVLGQSVNFTENRNSISLSGNGKGIYYYKIVKGMKITAGKLIF